MGTNVFANGREISAKKSDNQSLAAMPDVCLSPPSPPAGPLPLPYPNFSSASDTTDGTKTVKIAGDEAGMKDQSSYKSSKGDEAATRSFGMGVVSHTIQGKTSFAAWSFDVMLEGANAPRFMDLTTHNHGSASNAPSATGNQGSPKPGSAPNPDCQELDDENKAARAELATKTKDVTLVGKRGNGKGTTVSSGKLRLRDRGTSVMSAHNNQKAFRKCRRRFARGGAMKNRRAGKSNLCQEANHSHGSPCDQKSGHAEARMLDQMFKATPPPTGSLTLNIDWRPKGKPNSKMPCIDCHKMLCAAKACGLTISLCSNKNQKVRLTNEYCPATPGTQIALKQAMGESK